MPPRKPSKPLTEGQARDTALRALARREHSAAELKHKLARRGHPAETAEAVVATLADRGWQSDARYAEQLLRSRLRQGCGPLRIEHELAEAGLASPAIRAVLAEVEVDWKAQCAEVQRRKFATGPGSPTEWQKQYRFLASRGFAADQIRAALRAAPGAVAEPED